MQLPQSKKKKEKKAPEMTGGVSLSIYTETLGLQVRPIFRWPAQMTAPSAKILCTKNTEEICMRVKKNMYILGATTSSCGRYSVQLQSPNMKICSP